MNTTANTWRIPLIAHLLTHELTQKRKTRTHDGAGRHSEALSTLRTVNGRINPAGYRDTQRLYGQQPQAHIDHIVYLAAGSDVLINDVFVFGTRSFRVTVPNLDTPSVAIYQKAGLVEIQGG